MPPPRDVPVYVPDLYSATALRDPYPHYAGLRGLGPVVWLDKHKVYALPRHAECRAVLLDDETFVSGEGVALNPLANRLGQGTTLFNEGDDHDRRRSQVAHRLTPRALRTMKNTVDQQAAAVVEAAVARQAVDRVEVATALSMAVVPDFVGWPRAGREHLLRWAGAAFDVLGPVNRQALRTMPAALGMMRAMPVLSSATARSWKTAWGTTSCARPTRAGCRPPIVRRSWWTTWRRHSTPRSAPSPAPCT
ncbi:hypothetical protein ACWC09_47050 [Streptomyces sp. NPDC001617]